MIATLALVAMAGGWAATRRASPTQPHSPSGGLGSLFAGLQRDPKNDRAEHDAYDRGATERTAAELKTEKLWDARRTTDCAKFSVGSGPQLCIEHLGPSLATIGTPIAYRVRWRNLPSRAYVRVWSRNAAPAGERWRYPGAYGAIAPQALSGSSSGDVRVEWDGRGIYCAPSDLPMMCDAGEVGRYVLRAAMMTGSDPYWPSWPDRNPVPVTYLAQSETAPFTLDGPPQPIVQPGGNYRNYAFQQAIVKAIKTAVPETGADWYAERNIARLGPWTAGPLNYCATLKLDGQLVGSLDICFPKSRRDENGLALTPWDFTVQNMSRLAPALISSDEAVRLASAYALAMTDGKATFSSYPSEAQMVAVLHPDPRTYDGSYQGLRNAARDAGLTYVDINQPWPTFRDEAGGSWWLVETRLSTKIIDRDGGKDWGRLSLRVNQDGQVCRVERVGVSAEKGRGPRNLYSTCRAGSEKRMK